MGTRSVLAAAIGAVTLCACEQTPLLPPESTNPFLVSGTSVWSDVRSFPLDRRFEAVWGTPDGDVFIGYPTFEWYGDVIHVYDESAILRLDGVDTWVDTGYRGNVLSIWGMSRRDLIVAEGGSVQHLREREWQTMNAPIQHVYGFATDDVYAAGSEGVYHYDGNFWALVYEMQYGARAIWVSDQKEVFAVKWNSVTVIAPDGVTEYPIAGSLTDIWGSAGDDVVVVGERGTSQTPQCVFQFDGMQWTAADCPDGARDLMGVWGAAAGDIYAVGDGGTILHYDGAGWELLPRITGFDLLDVGGLGPDDVFAVGSGGRVLRYDGSGWSSIRNNAPGSVELMWVGNASEFVVMSYSSLFLFRDDSWTEIVLPQGKRATAIWMASIDDILVAVFSGEILQYDGATWTEAYAEAAVHYTAIGGSADGDVVAVGYAGVAERVGGAWKAVPPGQAAPRHLWVDPVAGDAVAVGDTRNVLVRKAGIWTQVAAPEGARFKGVWGRTINDVHLLAYDAVYQFDGREITDTNAPNARGMWLIAGDDERVVCAGSGLEIHRVGNRWRTYRSSPALHPQLLMSAGGTIYQVSRGALLAWETTVDQ